MGVPAGPPPPPPEEHPARPSWERRQLLLEAEETLGHHRPRPLGQGPGELWEHAGWGATSPRLCTGPLRGWGLPQGTP